MPYFVVKPAEASTSQQHRCQGKCRKDPPTWSPDRGSLLGNSYAFCGSDEGWVLALPRLWSQHVLQTSELQIATLNLGTVTELLVSFHFEVCPPWQHIFWKRAALASLALLIKHQKKRCMACLCKFVGVQGAPPPPHRRLAPLNGESLTGQTGNGFQAWQLKCVWMLLSSWASKPAMLSRMSVVPASARKCIGGKVSLNQHACKQMLMVPQEQAVPVADLRQKDFATGTLTWKCLTEEPAGIIWAMLPVWGQVSKVCSRKWQVCNLNRMRRSGCFTPGLFLGPLVYLSPELPLEDPASTGAMSQETGIGTPCTSRN